MNIMKNKESLSLKQKRIIGGLSVVLFIVFCGIVGWFIGRPMIKFVSEPEKFRLIRGLKEYIKQNRK